MASADDVMMRVSRELRDKVKQLADQEDRAMSAVLDDAVERYRRQQLLQAAGVAYRVLSQDERIQRNLLAERNLWLNYGLEGA